MRILWLIKIYRIEQFLKIFEYQNYNRFIRGVFALMFYPKDKNKLSNKLAKESVFSEVDCIK